MFDGVCNLLTYDYFVLSSVSLTLVCDRYKTANPDRAKARKFLAPAFSTNNLQKTTLDILYQRTNSILCEFHKCASENESVNMKEVSWSWSWSWSWDLSIFLILLRRLQLCWSLIFWLNHCSMCRWERRIQSKDSIATSSWKLKKLFSERR